MEISPVISRLLEEVEHGDELAAFEAAKRLAETDCAGAVVHLGRVLRSGAQNHSRRAAGYALGSSGQRCAIPILLECAADDLEEAEVRGEAIEGLVTHLRDEPIGSDSRSSAEELMLELLQSPSAALRFWACFGLGSLRCERAVPQLRRLSECDQDVYPGWWYVREEAEDALVWIAGGTTEPRIPVHKRESGHAEPGTPTNPASPHP